MGHGLNVYVLSIVVLCTLSIYLDIFRYIRLPFEHIVCYSPEIVSLRKYKLMFFTRIINFEFILRLFFPEV